MTKTSTTQGFNQELYAYCDELLEKFVRQGPGEFCAALSEARISELRAKWHKPGTKFRQMYLLNCLVSLERSVHGSRRPTADQIYTRMVMFLAAFNTMSAKQSEPAASAIAAFRVWG